MFKDVRKAEFKNHDEINIQLLCSTAVASCRGFWPPQTYACGYCKGNRGFSFEAVLYYGVIYWLRKTFMGVLPGKLQHVQQLIAHLFSSLKHTIKCQLLTLQKAALTAVNHTHTHLRLRLWLNAGFLQWRQSRALWPLWRALLHLAKRPGKLSGFPLSLGPPCGTLPSLSGTHRFEVTWAEHVQTDRVVFNNILYSPLGRVGLL